MTKKARWMVSLLAACCLATAAHAETTARAWLRQADNNPELKAKLTAKGKDAAFFCFNCHGDGGISRLTEVPNLAAQHPTYIINQIEAFLSGMRKDEFMQGLMKVLNEEEKAAIALYFSSAIPRPAASKPGPRAAEGRHLYVEYCERCHLPDASGSESFPRLAGQQGDYMRISLKRYMDMSGERLYPPMTGAVRQMGANNIDAIVDYLSAKH